MCPNLGGQSAPPLLKQKYVLPISIHNRPYFQYLYNESIMYEKRGYMSLY